MSGFPSSKPSKALSLVPESKPSGAQPQRRAPSRGFHGLSPHLPSPDPTPEPSQCTPRRKPTCTVSRGAHCAFPGRSPGCPNSLQVTSHRHVQMRFPHLQQVLGGQVALLAFVCLLGHGSLPGLRLVGYKKKGRKALHAHMRSGSWDALKTETSVCAPEPAHS